MTNKGAMFGLDARIALAIFGALSVISGAALYSAIQNSKATAIVTEMREVAKAFEAYYLDTGIDLERVATSGNDLHRRKVVGLVEDTGAAGWAGPYLSYEANGVGFLHHPTYSYFSIVSTSDVDWGLDNATAPSWYDSDALCSSSIQCYLWVQLTGISTELHDKVDEIVDGSDGADKGNFRYYKPASTYTYLLKFMPIDY